MIYKIIIVYLLGIICCVLNGTFFSLGLFLFTFGFIFQNFSKGHFFLHDIFIKDIFLKDMSFRKMSLRIVSFILLIFVFYMSFINTKRELQQVAYKNIDGQSVEIVGTIVSSSKQGNNQELTIKTQKVLNTLASNETEREITDKPKLINISVTQVNDFVLYDEVSVKGTLQFNNFQNYYDTQPLFFSYQFTKLLYNTPWVVSFPHSINVKHVNKTFVQNIFITLKSTSENFSDNINTYMSQPYAAIAQGISLGNQENIIKSIKDIFKKSGLIHILVLSGANVTFIISVCWYFLRQTSSKTNIGSYKRVKIFLLIFLSWIFIFLTGLTAPSVRAGVMASTNILSEYFGRNISTFYSLLLSLFILTIINPLTLVYSASLHLSFLACCGLFIATPKIEKWLENKFTYFQKHTFFNFLLSTNIGIFIFTTPYILALTGYSNLFGTILTFLVEPVAFLSTIFTFLIIVFSTFNFYLFNLVSTFLGWVNTVLIKIILYLADFGANNLPIINFQIGPNILIIYYILLFAIILKNDESK